MSLTRRWPGLLVLLTAVGLEGCGGVRVEDYAETAPAFDPRRFFDGEVQAWGIVQDWRGRVVRRFAVDIRGQRDGDAIVLDESFRYADGERDTRTWRITPDGDGTYAGRADDIVGSARGEAGGSAMRWRYAMDLAVDGRTWRVAFDDWMWQLDERVLVNRSRIRKFGLTVAEVTLFMQRAP
ncbi:MAG: DUF3833 domain-containing protein [Gammaproteobacteria bacterium]|nr:DUF3833 domain-containing protein [Gammaproteobacteria bacterium]MCP5200792.1 DUF3833 domain-containing protein [Gammaproteobacteria bacterium]